MKHIIVGIDAGKTAAIACLDLQGNIVHLSAQRFAGLEWFVNNIRSTGLPVVITSDKKKPNKITGRLAAIFSAVLFVPNEDIGVRRKKSLSRGNVESAHERDALAAARVAYNNYANKLKQTEKLAKQQNLDNIDSIQALVIKRSSMYEAVSGTKPSRLRR